MNKHRFASIVFAGLLLALVATNPVEAKGINQIPNGSFENDNPAGWILSDDAIITDEDSYLGTQSVCVTQTESSEWQTVYHPVQLEEGIMYTVEGWMKLENVSQSAVKVFTGSHTYFIEVGAVGTGTRDWFKFSKAFVAEATETGNLMCMAGWSLDGSNAGITWFDGITITRMAEGVDLIQNGGFEQGFEKWIVNGNASIDVEDTCLGENSAHITHTQPEATGWQTISQKIQLEEGVLYTVEGWIKFDNASQSALTVWDGFNRYYPLIGDVGTGTVGWSKFSSQFIAKETRTADLWCHAGWSRDGENEASTWFDDIRVVRHLPKALEEQAIAYQSHLIRTQLEEQVKFNPGEFMLVQRTESPMTTILPDRPNPRWAQIASRVEPLVFKLARNERESVQAAILNLERIALTDVAIEVTPLIHDMEDGNQVTNETISVHMVDYIQCPPTPTDNLPIEFLPTGYGDSWWPDALIPTDSIDLSAIGNSSNQRVLWLTMYAPSNAPAGRYTGALRLRQGANTLLEVPIEAEVWDFELPKKFHLSTIMAFKPEEHRRYYNSDFDSNTDLENYIAFFSQRRLSLRGITNDLYKTDQERIAGIGITINTDETYSFDFSELERRIGRLRYWNMDRFNVALSISHSNPWEHFPLYDETLGQIRDAGFTDFEGDAFWDFYTAYLTSINAHFNAKGWGDMLYWYGYDEPYSSERMEEFLRIATRVKAVVPNLPIVVTRQPPEPPESDNLSDGWEGLVDHWIPLDTKLRLDTIGDLQDRGAKVWWYFIGHGLGLGRPAPHSRMVAWASWKYNLKAILHWGVNEWTWAMSRNLHENPLERWPNSDWEFGTENSGWLCYPGSDGKPWPSIRLENLRDGMEDYEYLWLLNEAVNKPDVDSNQPWVVEAKALLQVKNELIGGPAFLTCDTAAITKEREAASVYLQMAMTMEDQSPAQVPAGDSGGTDDNNSGCFVSSFHLR